MREHKTLNKTGVIGHLTYGRRFARCPIAGEVSMTSVLLVAPSPHIAATLVPWLTEAGCQVCVVASFATGKAHLEHNPSLLISEVRLGDYNGLHLAIRAKSRDIPAIVIGERDPALQREAEALGVMYMPGPLNRQHIVDALDRVVHTSNAPFHIGAGNVSFVSWDELVPAIGGRHGSSDVRRRTLPS
jgi:DNA-binding response OmpR family regulator